MRIQLWFFALLLCLSSPPVWAQKHVLINVKEYLTLRDKAAKNGAAVATLTPFQPVQVLKREKDWAEVKTTQGQTGWAPAAFLTKNMFVLLEQEHLNARRGPGPEYDVLIEYSLQNLPLCVLDSASNGWLFVMDFEGDRGWINPKMVRSGAGYVITREKKCNVRKEPAPDKELAFQTERGVLLKVLDTKEGWLRVKHKDTDEGWISEKIVFGWLDESDPSKKTAATQTASVKPTAEPTAKKEAAAKSTGKTAKTGKTSAAAQSKTTKLSSANPASTKSTSKKSSTKTSAAKTGDTGAASKSN